MWTILKFHFFSLPKEQVQLIPSTQTMVSQAKTKILSEISVKAPSPLTDNVVFLLQSKVILQTFRQIAKGTWCIIYWECNSKYFPAILKIYHLVLDHGEYHRQIKSNGQRWTNYGIPWDSHGANLYFYFLYPQITWYF